MLNIVQLMSYLDELKHLKRTGWLMHGIPEPETVASHMYRMAMLTMVVDMKHLDHYKCLRMALVHDLAEAITGDITPHCVTCVRSKYQLEKQAMNDISKSLPVDVSNDWTSLWCEYEEGTTLEAQVVKHLDKFDMIAQAFEYEKKYSIDLDQFFTSTKKFFTLEPFKTWDRDLRKRRQEYMSSSENGTTEAGSSNANSLVREI